MSSTVRILAARHTSPAITCRAGQRGPDDELATQLALARQAETQAHELARDIRTLTQCLRHDVLALAGPALATLKALFDFVVEEMARREPAGARRIRPVRVALQNQRDDLLAFAGVLDAKLAAIAQTYAIAECRRVPFWWSRQDAALLPASPAIPASPPAPLIP